MEELHRISFWRSNFLNPSDDACNDDNLLGYAILKRDIVLSGNDYSKWHIFEAVFNKYPDEHNCCPNPNSYSVRLADKIFSIRGLLYAQQNRLNKACAQVALRSLISRIKHSDVSYREINNFAGGGTAGFNPANGLNATQIQRVLGGFDIPFLDMDYTLYNESEDKRHSQPYQSYVYSGIESGQGALVGFRPSIPDRDKHIIPFYGHTFNKDIWTPDADKAYFSAGNLGYTSSQYWTSSFLGHDDNFGANYCVPRLYIPTAQVDYVVELLKPKFQIRGAQAEGLSIQLLSSVIDHIDATGNKWLQRLVAYANVQQVVLRALAVDRECYINHIRNEHDWDGNSEREDAINLFSTGLPESFWVVEISIPQLFPANERKLGDVVIKGQMSLGDIYSHLLYVRLPGGYYMLRNTSKPEFKSFPSNFTSHLPVLKLN